MKKLSAISERAVEAFDEAAQDHGWEKDQGSQKAAVKAEENYNKTKEALIKRLWYLEQRVRHFQAKDF